MTHFTPGVDPSGFHHWQSLPSSYSKRPQRRLITTYNTKTHFSLNTLSPFSPLTVIVCSPFWIVFLQESQMFRNANVQFAAQAIVRKHQNSLSSVLQRRKLELPVHGVYVPVRAQAMRLGKAGCCTCVSHSTLVRLKNTGLNGAL